MQIFYKIDFSQKDQKYVHITQTFNFDNYNENKLVLIMPVWSPGSYLVREYSRILDCLESNNKFIQTTKNICDTTTLIHK